MIVYFNNLITASKFALLTGDALVINLFINECALEQRDER
jgi:hypothetical protein